MLLNTREWLRAGSLATIALICGLALRTPKQGDAVESAPPPRSAIADLSDALASVAQHVKPAVVLVQSQRVERVERAVMGLSIRDATEQDAGVVGLKQITGVVVNGYTSDDSPAKQAGIQPGDVIVSLGGEPVESTPQLQERVGFKRAGETVAVTLVRQGGETKKVTLRLARAPTDVKPDGDPIYYGGTLDPVIVEARRDPTPVK